MPRLPHFGVFYRTSFFGKLKYFEKKKEEEIVEEGEEEETVIFANPSILRNAILLPFTHKEQLKYIYTVVE